MPRSSCHTWLRMYAYQPELEQPQVACAWQAPSTAMLLVKMASRDRHPKIHQALCSRGFGELLAQAISGFGEGRLPGNLGDTPEALDTGEGSAEKPQLWLSFDGGLEYAACDDVLARLYTAHM